MNSFLFMILLQGKNVWDPVLHSSVFVPTSPRHFSMVSLVSLPLSWQGMG